MVEPDSKMNLLMLSGDSSVAQGRESTFYRMLHRFSMHWERVDVICPRAKDAEARTVHGNVYLHPSPWHKARQPWFIKQKTFFTTNNLLSNLSLFECVPKLLKKWWDNRTLPERMDC